MRLKVDLNIVLTEFEGSGKLVWIYFKEEEFVTMRDVSAKLKREYPGLGGVKFSFYIQDGLVPKNESVAILQSDDILVIQSTDRTMPTPGWDPWLRMSGSHRRRCLPMTPRPANTR